MREPEVAGYQIERLLGRGGFASVHLATSADREQPVALKILGDHASSDEDLHRFDRERRSLTALAGHPHIVDVLDAGVTDEGVHWMALEYVDGGSLRDRLDARGAIHWSEVIQLGIELCGALDAAHRAGVLHRDIKPANILLDANGAKLGDFGIARLVGVSNVTAAQSLVGTLAYTPPEILHNRPFDGRGDLYQLGMTMYEALLGRTPFTSAAADNKATVIRRILEDPAPPLAQFDVPQPLSDLLDRVLAKSPDDRPPSADALRRELREVEVLLGNTPPVSPASTAEPSPAWPAAATAPLDRPASPTSGAPRGDETLVHSASDAPDPTQILDAPASPPPSSASALPSRPQSRRRRGRWLGVALATVGAAAIAVGAIVALTDSPAETPGDALDEPGDSTETTEPVTPLVDTALTDAARPVGIAFGLVENAAGLTIVGGTGLTGSASDQSSTVWTWGPRSNPALRRPQSFAAGQSADGQRLWDIDVLESVALFAVGESAADGVAWVGPDVGRMSPTAPVEATGAGRQRLRAVAADEANDSFVVGGQITVDGGTVPAIWNVTATPEGSWSNPQWAVVDGIGGGSAGIINDIAIDGTITVAVGREGSATNPSSLMLVRTEDTWSPLIGPLEGFELWGVTITPDRIVATGTATGAPVAVVVDREGQGRWHELPRIDNVDGTGRDVAIVGDRVFAVGTLAGTNDQDPSEQNGAIWELLTGNDLADDVWTTRHAGVTVQDEVQEYWAAAAHDGELWIVGAATAEDTRPAAIWRVDPDSMS